MKRNLIARVLVGFFVILLIASMAAGCRRLRKPRRRRPRQRPARLLPTWST